MKKTDGTRTMAQAERQAAREETSGRYNRLNPCYVCDVSVGANYYSSMHTDLSFVDADGATQNFADAALVVDATCSAMLDAMPIADAWNFIMDTPVADRRAAKRRFAATQRAAGRVQA